MPHEFAVTRRVEFADTDTAGVIHFTALFRYMEEAEHAFYRSLGSSAYRREADHVEGMPRVSASCDFHRPLRYADEVEVRLTVREKTRVAIAYDVAFRKVDGEERAEVARGTMKVVNVARPYGSLEWKAVDLPRVLQERIQVAPPGTEDEVTPP